MEAETIEEEFFDNISEQQAIDMLAAIEAKSSHHITSDHMKGLHEIKKDHPGIKKRIIVCLEKSPRLADDGIEVLPYKIFVKKLWTGELFSPL